jgi:restriction system protein
MANSKRGEGPQFVRFFAPVIEALRELGGSGRPSEVKDLLIRTQ